MIVKDYIFLTLIIILLQWTRGQAQELDEHFQKSPCCSEGNILIDTGCLEISKKIEEARRNNDINSTKGIQKTKLLCPNGKYILDLSEDDESFTIDEYQSIYLGDHKMGSQGMYCLTNRADINDSIDILSIDPTNLYTKPVALVCFVDNGDTFLPPSVTGILSFISVAFLILTILVYAIVPQLRDLQGKCVMCTAISLCIGFYHLAIAQFITSSNSIVCQAAGFLLYFWILGAFFWMNVVSINVMRSVSVKSPTISEKKMFIYYSIYGWGSPLLFLLAAIIANSVEGTHIKPGFGDKVCWFSAKLETWTYFYGPVLILITCNIILFVLTSIKLWNQTSYENVTKIRSMKYRFLLYLKIFLVMGISWIFEILSFVHDTKHIVWLITDTFNSLQGLVFFLVLVLFRKRALKGLAAKGIRIPCALSAHHGPDEECDEIIGEEEAPALTVVS